MSDAYLNLIKAARYSLGCKGPGVTPSDIARADLNLKVCMDAAEKELEAHQREELNAGS